MLPEAHLALMDEIGKANSIVRNSALGLMNEREFLNGKTKLRSPLISMIGCSNELLDGEEDRAFWDRLSLRYMVDYLGDEDLRTLLLRKTSNIAAPQITTMLSLAELEQMQTAVKNVTFLPQSSIPDRLATGTEERKLHRQHQKIRADRHHPQSIRLFARRNRSQ